MEANNSINRSDIQRQLYKALVDAYKADKILLDTYGDSGHNKRPRDDADDDQETLRWNSQGPKEEVLGKEPLLLVAPKVPLLLIPNSKVSIFIPFHHFINNDLEYLRGGVSSRKYSTSVTKTTAADYRHIKWIEDLVPNSMWSQIRQIRPLGNLTLGQKAKTVLCICDLREQLVFKEGDFHARIQRIEEICAFARCKEM
ncbi:hypothetical protein Tco_0855644 [Tanacetum coccineum]